MQSLKKLCQLVTTGVLIATPLLCDVRALKIDGHLAVCTCVTMHNIAYPIEKNEIEELKIRENMRLVTVENGVDFKCL